MFGIRCNKNGAYLGGFIAELGGIKLGWTKDVNHSLLFTKLENAKNTLIYLNNVGANAMAEDFGGGDVEFAIFSKVSDGSILLCSD